MVIFHACVTTTWRAPRRQKPRSRVNGVLRCATRNPRTWSKNTRNARGRARCNQETGPMRTWGSVEPANYRDRAESGDTGAKDTSVAAAGYVAPAAIRVI